MNTSEPPRNTIARKPSHLGSYRKPSPAGSSSASFASIGSIGGAIGNGFDRDGQCIMPALKPAIFAGAVAITVALTAASAFESVYEISIRARPREPFSSAAEPAVAGVPPTLHSR